MTRSAKLQMKPLRHTPSPSTELVQATALEGEVWDRSASWTLPPPRFGRQGVTSISRIVDAGATLLGSSLGITKTLLVAPGSVTLFAYHYTSINAVGTVLDLCDIDHPDPIQQESSGSLADGYPTLPWSPTSNSTVVHDAWHSNVNTRIRLVLNGPVLERTGVRHRLHYLPSPVLRQRAEPVAAVNDDVRRLVDDLFTTMRANGGVGLAANQIGVPLRIAVVDVGEDDGPPLVLINPRIIDDSGTIETAEEGCLSIPAIFGDVERPLRVVFEALDLDGRPYRDDVSGFKARAVQHEIDHLDGVLFIDRLSAVKRGLLLAKWKKLRKGKAGYLQEFPPGDE